MAVLPQLDQSAVPNYSGGIPPEASPGAFGQVGEALQTAGYRAERTLDNVLQRYSELQVQADDARATDEALAFRSSKRKYLLDPTSGALFTQGKDALGIYDKGEQDLGALAKEHEDQLTNDRQKALFRHAIGVDLESSLDQLGEHEARTIQQYRVDTAKATVDTAIEDAIASADDPKRQGNSLRLMEDMIRLNVDHAPQAEVDYRVADSRSKVVAGTIHILAPRNPDAAIAYLNGHSHELQGTDRLGVEQAIDSGMRTRMAQQEHAMAVQERYERKAQQERAKEGDALAATGRLTADWIEHNRHNLDEGDFRHFYDVLTRPPDRPEVRSDPNILAGFLDRKRNGDDVYAESRSAYIGQHISEADFKWINESKDSEPRWEKDAEQQIKLISGYSEFNPTPDAGAQYANSLRDFHDWARDNPNASDKEAIQRAREYADSYRFVKVNHDILTMPRSRYTVMSPDNKAMDYAATLRAFDEARKAGNMTPEEQATEAKRIQDMAEALRASGQLVEPPPPPQPPPPPPPVPPPDLNAVPGVPGARFGGQGREVYGRIPPAAPEPR